MTLFARVVGGEVVEWGALPFSARRLDTGEVIFDLPGENAHWQKATGWFPVVVSAAPSVAGEVPTFTVEMVDGKPVQVWSVRPMTDRERLQSDMSGAVSTLRTWAAETGTVVVTSENVVPVLQSTVDRLAVLLDRVADLIELED